MERKHKDALCERCPYGNQPGYVPTLNLRPKSKIAVIGEAPGQYEAAYGIPFTGPSGDLLNTVLAHHNIRREDIMITNTCLCRPDNNEDPPKSALEACAPRLHREIEESGVEKIIAVGKVASQSLTELKGSMRKMRVGPPKPYKVDSRIQVIPTWHPAYSLRSPDSFPDLVYDFGKVKQVFDNVWTEPQYRVIDDIVLAERAMQKLSDGCDRLVLDIECGVEKDAAFVHPSEFPLLCVGFAYAPKRAVVFGENVCNHPKFGSLLRRLLSRVKLIAHNGKFDLAGLRNVAGKQLLWFDTMLASYCLVERSGCHGLKQLSIEKLGAPDYEQAIREYIPRSGNYADIPRPILYRYNAYDVVCTWELYELFNEQMNGDDCKKHDLLIRAANALIELELSGIAFDLIYNKELHEQFLGELAEIEAKMTALVGREINPRSVPQVTRYYEEHKLFLPNTEADLLKALAEKIEGEPLEFTKLLLHHRKRAKLFGTYVKGLAKRVSHGRVYTTYLLHGTTSGRLSSRNPNLQNVTREQYIRNQFTVTNEENVFVQFDYKQAEGRVIATLAKEQYLADIFRDPSRDIFNELCNEIFGLGKWNKENRVAMKSVFYGDSYGRGALSITNELNLQGVPITETETREFMRKFHQLTPNIRAWQAAIKHTVLNGNDLVTPYGRRRSFWLITDKNRTDVLNEALSFLPQSIASDICLEALITVQPMLEGLATLRLTIHDALVLECHRDRVDEVTGLVKNVMIESARRFTDYVPFAVDVSVGTRWGEL